MNNDAFVLGHNTLYPSHRGDFGEPPSQPLTIDSPLKPDTSPPYDSGIGGSSGSSFASDRDTAHRPRKRPHCTENLQYSPESISMALSQSCEAHMVMSSTNCTIGIICENRARDHIFPAKDCPKHRCIS